MKPIPYRPPVVLESQKFNQKVHRRVPAHPVINALTSTPSNRDVRVHDSCDIGGGDVILMFLPIANAFEFANQIICASSNKKLDLVKTMKLESAASKN